MAHTKTTNSIVVAPNRARGKNMPTDAMPAAIWPWEVPTNEPPPQQLLDGGTGNEWQMTAHQRDLLYQVVMSRSNQSMVTIPRIPFTPACLLAESKVLTYIEDYDIYTTVEMGVRVIRRPNRDGRE